METFPIWAVAWFWAVLGASSLIAGAVTAYAARMPKQVTAGIMAFGCGVLISAVAYDLLQDGAEEGGIWPVAIGALAGSLIYVAADWAVSRRGEGGGMAVLMGALIDGIPESLVLGVGLLAGGGVSWAMLAAILLSNYPEALASAEGMKADGRSLRWVLGHWGLVVLASGAAAALGAGLLAGAGPKLLAAINAVAAGGLLTMVVNTLVPEAVAGDRRAAGVLAVAGLLVAFVLTN